MDRAAVMVREHNDRAWLAWHVAALGRVKRLPAIKKLMAEQQRRPKPRQTWQEQLRIMDMWVARTNPKRKRGAR